MKPWQDEIRQHIERWSAQLGDRHWWPRFVYHFTDVRNAASIITTGYLYSRLEAERLGLMQVDNASPQIIAQTRTEHKQYARLYFRPRTPTQYRNEGIRPTGQRELGGAHCPIPVYFCFGALEVLGQDDTEFSDGNMGSDRAQHRCDREFFLSIPFSLVFHHGPIPPSEVQEVKFRRHAEVLVPHGLALTPDLKFVVCRSVAERQTLLHLLPPELRATWAPTIRLGHQGLFERKWTYVEDVLAVGDSVVFTFNPSTQTAGPFQVSFIYTERGGHVSREWHGQRPTVNSRLRFRVPGASQGTAQLRLDEALAFAGPLIFKELPF
jgi:hypothetical protein